MSHCKVTLLALVVLVGGSTIWASTALAQTQPRTTRNRTNLWRTPRTADSRAQRPAPAATADGSEPVRPIADVQTVAGSAPRGIRAEAGQTWQEYDISPYTMRVTSTNRPEQAVIDWILRDTGYEAWHSATPAVLSADERRLRVFHTPQMQQVVAGMVDRFVSSEAQAQTFGMRVVTLDNPNWRARAHRVLQGVPVQSQGVQAWLMQKEEAALLLTELAKRTDYREHSSPDVIVSNGQSYVLSRRRAKNYMQDIQLKPNTWPGFETRPTQFDEGFALEFSPLIARDGAMVDAVVKCHIDQVEKLTPVVIEVPTPVAPRQRTKIDVPQVSQFRMQERFRWPVEQVLVIGLGMVPTPYPPENNPLRIGFGKPDPPRADLLVIIENKGRRSQLPVSNKTAATKAGYRGR